MRLIVCGGRDYRDRQRVYEVLDAHNPSEIATGVTTVGMPIFAVPART